MAWCQRTTNDTSATKKDDVWFTGVTAGWLAILGTRQEGIYAKTSHWGNAWRIVHVKLQWQHCYMMHDTTLLTFTQYTRDVEQQSISSWVHDKYGRMMMLLVSCESWNWCSIQQQGETEKQKITWLDSKKGVILISHKSTYLEEICNDNTWENTSYMSIRGRSIEVKMQYCCSKLQKRRFVA